MSDLENAEMSDAELLQFEREMRNLSLDHDWFGAARRGLDLLIEVRRRRAAEQSLSSLRAELDKANNLADELRASLDRALRLRADGWLEKAAEEIAVFPLRDEAAFVVRILRKHRDGTA